MVALRSEVPTLIRPRDTPFELGRHYSQSPRRKSSSPYSEPRLRMIKNVFRDHPNAGRILDYAQNLYNADGESPSIEYFEDSLRPVLDKVRDYMALPQPQLQSLLEVRGALSQQERERLWVTEMYYHHLLSPIGIGLAFIRYRKKYRVRQDELSEQTGISPPTINTYESLIWKLIPELHDEVEKGKLTVKEARAIADLSYNMQRTVASFFLDDTLSSEYVEEVVRRVKATESLGKIVEEIKERRSRHKPRTHTTTDNIVKTMLKLSSELDDLATRNVSEIRRLNLEKSARILKTKLTSLLSPSDSQALSHLLVANNSPTRGPDLDTHSRDAARLKGFAKSAHLAIGYQLGNTKIVNALVIPLKGYDVDIHLAFREIKALIERNPLSYGIYRSNDGGQIVVTIEN